MEAQAWGERYVLSHLSDDALLAGTRRLVGTSNHLFADLLAHLAEVEARGVHRLRLCVSLYTYCIYELRFSEDAAFRRVSAARLVKAFPALFDAVASGELHLTGLLMIGPHLTQGNHVEVLARAKHRTKKELAALIRQIDPLPNVPARIEPLGPAETPPGHRFRKPTYEQFVTSMNPVRDLSPGERPRDWIDESALAAAAEAASNDIGPAPARKDLTDESGAAAETSLRRAIALAAPPVLEGPQRYCVQFTAKDEYVQLVERAKALLSHTSAAASLEELHLRAMQALVAQLERRRYGVKKRTVPLSSSDADTALALGSDSEVAVGLSPDTESSELLANSTPSAVAAVGVSTEPPRQRGRYVPAAVRRAVYVRDEARCGHLGTNGERCRETHRLEFHHLVPFALGGEDTIENIGLRCRCHNVLAAQQDFGCEKMQESLDRVRHESFQRQAMSTVHEAADDWSDLAAARSPSLASGEAFARTGAERTPVREHRTGAKTSRSARSPARWTESTEAYGPSRRRRERRSRSEARTQDRRACSTAEMRPMTSMRRVGRPAAWCWDRRRRRDCSVVAGFI